MEIKREAYYYARDKQNRPVVTVCLLVDDKCNIARGVAICSAKDSPNKVWGRALSRSRALACFQSMGMHSMEPVRRKEALEVLVSLPGKQPYHLMAKAWWNPALTEFERDLVEDGVVDAEFPEQRRAVA